jgi:Secretion system C-terminal sorting domain
MKHLILFVFLLNCLNTNAQNWQSFSGANRVYFEEFNEINNFGAFNTYLPIKTPKLDSMRLYRDAHIIYDSIFGNIKTIKFANTFLDTNYIFTMPSKCININSASIWGKECFRDTNNGLEYYINIYNDSILIKTYANTGDTWLLHKDRINRDFIAQVLSQDTLKIDGVLDSIKTISITCLLNGNPDTSVFNNKQLVLSKNHGIILAIPFFTFPYTNFKYINGLLPIYNCNYKRINNYLLSNIDDSIKIDQNVINAKGNVIITEFHVNIGNNETYMLNYDSIIDFGMISTNKFYVVRENIQKGFSWNYSNPPGQAYSTYTDYAIKYDTLVKPMIEKLNIKISEENLTSIYTPFQANFINIINDKYKILSIGKYDPINITNNSSNCFITEASLAPEYGSYTTSYLDYYGLVTNCKNIQKNGIFQNSIWQITYCQMPDGTEPFGKRLSKKAVLSMSVDELKINNAFQIYPNPATNILNIKTSTPYNNTTYEIFNTQGNCVLKSNVTANAIDVSALLPSIYFLKINCNNKIIYKQFTKN